MTSRKYVGYQSCSEIIEMNFIQRVQLCCVAGATVVAASSACSSPPARTNSSGQQTPLVHADSEVFDAVVRAQLAGNQKDYPPHLDGLRFDSRPSTPVVPFRFTATPSRRTDTSGLFAAPDAATLDRLAANRKQILERAGVEQSAPQSYSNCAGTRVPPPPPPVGSSGSASASQPDIHAACPRRPENYLTVSLPVRGQPIALNDRPDPRGQRVRLTGEVWTVVVERTSAGPSGSMWTQEAWLFTRNPSTRRLQLATTIPLGIIE
jgi:hypothetical protein